MTSVDLERFDPQQLSDFLGEFRTEFANRERKRRKNLGGEFEHPLAHEDYKRADPYPQLACANGSCSPQCRLSVRFQNPQAPVATWTGVGRTPRWVKSILGHPGITMARSRPSPCFKSPHSCLSVRRAERRLRASEVAFNAHYATW